MVSPYIFHCPSPPALFSPPSPVLTDKEEQALGMLKEAIPELLSPSQGEQADRERAWLSQACLLRYLRAHRWSVPSAKKGLAETLEWRRSYKPDMIPPEEVRVEGETGKTFPSGFDRMGRPIIYMRPRLENTKTSDRQLRYVVFVLERALAMMPPGVETVTLVIDYKGASMRQSPGISTCKSFLHILSNHYPERLGRAFVVDGPWYFFTLFRMLNPFMDPVTREKVWFVDLEKQKTMELEKSAIDDYTSLLYHIHPDMLDDMMGGNLNMPFDHAQYWPQFLEETGGPIRALPSWESRG
ncbi:MAG: CRAL-TRIO domain-containing protein [Piptocephalis tieghemiana]|nr:MAG: CRAL-TRIO domain-containing protein [Piptocephalis tieghemiana]